LNIQFSKNRCSRCDTSLVPIAEECNCTPTLEACSKCSRSKGCPLFKKFLLNKRNCGCAADGYKGCVNTSECYDNKYNDGSNNYHPTKPCTDCTEVTRCGDFDNNYALGISYVPWQDWKDILCKEEALDKGTVFTELVKPFGNCERRSIYG